jgi:uncharacterized damage-inducible protein DinB
MSRITRALLMVALALPAATLGAQAPTTGWRAEFLATMDQAANRYIQLAEAMPAEKYTWRPAEGVRSVSEVYLHVSQANYGFATRLGAPPMTGLNMQNFDKSTTDKAEVIRHLRESFARFRAAVVAYPDADSEKMMRWFGPPEITARHFLFFNADHMGEPLGQSIAYARMNGVVPPWSTGGN